VINCGKTSDGRRRGVDVGVYTKALLQMKEEKLIELWRKRNRTCGTSGHRRQEKERERWRKKIRKPGL
jgi:hypothetical protein